MYFTLYSFRVTAVDRVISLIMLMVKKNLEVLFLAVLPDVTPIIFSGRVYAHVFPNILFGLAIMPKTVVLVKTKIHVHPQDSYIILSSVLFL